MNLKLDITEQLLELHQGQGMDIYWRDSYTCPTEQQYKDMVIKSMYNIKPNTLCLWYVCNLTQIKALLNVAFNNYI